MAVKGLTLQLDGLERIQRQLTRIAQGAQKEFQRALHAELEVEMTEAKRRTPVDTGALRASGHVLTRLRGRDVEGEMRFGGPAAPYAVIVHENLEAFHAVGQAKFLESTLNESLSLLAHRIAVRISTLKVFGTL